MPVCNCLLLADLGRILEVVVPSFTDQTDRRNMRVA